MRRYTATGFHFYKQEIHNMEIYSFKVYSETLFKRKKLPQLKALVRNLTDEEL